MKHCPTKEPSPDSWKGAAFYAAVVAVSVISSFVIICHAARKSISVIAPM